MAGPDYPGLGAAAEAIMRDANNAARFQASIDKMFPRSLTESMASSAAVQYNKMFPQSLTEGLASAAAAQLDRMYPRGLTESLAAATAAQMERYFDTAHGGFMAAIAAATQRMLDRTYGGFGTGGTLAAMAASHSAKMSSLMPGLAGLEEASRAMQRRMDLEASITADWERLSEVAIRPYRDIADAIGASLAADVIARSLGGSWHDAFGTDFALEVREAFEEQVAEDPEQSVWANALAAVIGLLARYGVKVEPYWITAIAISLMAALASYTPSESARLDAEAQVADINWHTDLQIQRQNLFIEAFATKEIIHGTRMWTRPDSASKVLGRVAKGALVIPRRRKGKWAEVGIRTEDSPTGAAITGWMLNKYVK